MNNSYYQFVTNMRVIGRMFAYSMEAMYQCDPREKKLFNLWAFGTEIKKDHVKAWNKKHGHQLMINEDFTMADIKKIIDYYEEQKRK